MVWFPAVLLLKVTLLLLCVNIELAFLVQFPPTNKSPPASDDNVSVAVPAEPSVMFPFTESDAVIGLVFIDNWEPSSINKFPAIPFATAVAPFPRSNNVLLLIWTLPGKPAPEVEVHSNPLLNVPEEL